MNLLGDPKYFDACVYTSFAGREQLRIAALTLARAIVGYSADPGRQAQGTFFQQHLEADEGALDRCISIRGVWELGTAIQNPSTQANKTEIDGIKPAMDHLTLVARNIYAPPGWSMPWLKILAVLAIGGGGYYAYRKYYKPRHRKAEGAAVAGTGPHSFINAQNYRWFVITPSGKIVAGNEYKSDAIDAMRDFQADAGPTDAGLKVVALSTLKKRGGVPTRSSSWVTYRSGKIDLSSHEDDEDEYDDEDEE